MMADKPELPVEFPEVWPRIVIDETDESPFYSILRMASFAADIWTFGPNGPYEQIGMTPANITRGQLRDALLHLLELGVIDIDVERLNANHFGWPAARSDMR